MSNTTKLIDLARGHPSVRLLALKEIAAASQKVLINYANTQEDDLSDEDRHPLQYGTDQGPFKVRHTFAKWFTGLYRLRSPVDPDLLSITCGASYGLANTLLQFADAQYTRRIFLISPAYFLAARIFQDAGFGGKLCAINESDQGVSVKHLKQILEEDKKQDTQGLEQKQEMPGKRYRYLFYCVPTFSNPSGMIWSLKNRVQLVELAREYDILLCSDEVYDFLDYRQKDCSDLLSPIKRLVDIDMDIRAASPGKADMYGNTLSNMSFSKYLGPGIRCGVVQSATKEFMVQWAGGGANHSGGNTAQMTSFFVAELVQSGAINDVLMWLRETYRERARVMLRALESEMPQGTKIWGGQGGYFIWVELPPGFQSTSQILSFAKSDSDQPVTAIAGSAFEVPGDEIGWDQRFFRISLSFEESERASIGIKQFGRAIAASKSM